MAGPPVFGFLETSPVSYPNDLPFAQYPPNTVLGVFRLSGTVALLNYLELFMKILPFLFFLYGGIYSILEALFPKLRDAEFNRWEIDEGSGTSITFLGWKKVLSPPRVLAQGYMSDSAACVVAVCSGCLFIFIALIGIRHFAGIPAFLPDLFAR